jgi:hypothetical protein
MTILRGLLNDMWYAQIPQDQANLILRSLIGRSSSPQAMPLHIDSFVRAAGSFALPVRLR